MNVSADILKMIYQQSVNPVNTDSVGSVGTSSDLSNENSFLSILNQAIYKNGANKLTLDTQEDDKGLNNNDLSLAISLLMQQITGSSMTGQYQIEDILNNLDNSDGLGIEALTGVYNNSYDSNIDKLIESLQQLQQSKDGTQENVVGAMNSESPVITKVESGRSFPKEIMDSINAAREARELIRSRINQIRDFTGKANVVQTDTSNSIEELLANGLTAADLQNFKVSLTLADDLSNAQELDSILDIEQAGSTEQSLLDSKLLDTEFLLVDKASQNAEENSNTDSDSSRIDVVDENLLDTNVIDTIQARTDNKADKIGDDFTAVKGNVIEQIKDQVSMMRANGKQAVTMHLKPEELGKLDIKMVLENGNLSIEILTSNAKAHSLILSSIPELESVLKNSMAQDRNFMNFDNSKQLSEENARQNNRGYNGQQSQQQEQNEQKSGYEQYHTTGSEDNEKVDFYTAFSRMRQAREQILTRN